MTEGNTTTESVRDDRVWFVKLVTGEELFARIPLIEDQAISLEDPMMIEAIEFQGSKQILMTRYAPYVDALVRVMPLAAIICQPANETMTRYYLSCLQYQHQSGDKKWSNAVDKAVKSMREDTPESAADWNQRLMLSSLALITDSKN